MKTALSPLDRSRLEKLLEQMLETYRASASDRKLLWSSPQESSFWSAFCAAEVKSADAAGTVTTWLDRGIADTDPRIAGIQSWSMTQLEDVKSWKADNPGKFEAFTRYLDAIEELRVAAAFIAACHSTHSEGA